MSPIELIFENLVNIIITF